MVTVESLVGFPNGLLVKGFLEGLDKLVDIDCEQTGDVQEAKGLEKVDLLC